MASPKKTAKVRVQRPPIVALMGHVDHGKTTLLRALRKEEKGGLEAGGITQKISLYQLTYKNKKITFIDTPGHAAFSQMRSRGAQVTDLAVLVIAADDGVKPQTKESLKYIHQAKLPFLVAINKIDHPNASVKKVKNQLAEAEVLVEDYGGKIVCVEISAKQKKGLDELQEMILLLAEMEELQADRKSPLQAVVVDSKLDPRKGPTAVLLIKNGCLRIGDQLFAEETSGRVKAIINQENKRIPLAEPAQPIEVLGFKKVPPVGVEVSNQEIIRKRKPAVKTKPAGAKAEPEKTGKIKIILKADSLGSLEALRANLAEEIELIAAEAGRVNESDILLAESTGAQLITFSLQTPKSVQKLAQMKKINIKSYNIIYKLLEDLEKKILKMLEPTIDEEILGQAEIIAEFNIKGSHIAGCKVKKGRLEKKDLLHLQRKDKIIADARIQSLEKEREEVKKAKAGTEVGIVFTRDLDFKIGDDIIAYKKLEEDHG